MKSVPSTTRRALLHVLAALALMAIPASAQQTLPRDPAEPPQQKPMPKPAPKLLPRPAGAVVRSSVDEKSMRALIAKLVACGTRLTLSAWDDPKRGAGCGRDVVVARFNEIAAVRRQIAGRGG